MLVTWMYHLNLYNNEHLLMVSLQFMPVYPFWELESGDNEIGNKREKHRETKE